MLNPRIHGTQRDQAASDQVVRSIHWQAGCEQSVDLVEQKSQMKLAGFDQSAFGFLRDITAREVHVLELSLHLIPCGARISKRLRVLGQLVGVQLCDRGSHGQQSGGSLKLEIGQRVLRDHLAAASISWGSPFDSGSFAMPEFRVLR